MTKTSANELMDAVTQAARAVKDAIDVMNKPNPHMEHTRILKAKVQVMNAAIDTFQTEHGRAMTDKQKASTQMERVRTKERMDDLNAASEIMTRELRQVSELVDNLYNEL